MDVHFGRLHTNMGINYGIGRLFDECGLQFVVSHRVPDIQGRFRYIYHVMGILCLLIQYTKLPLSGIIRMKHYTIYSLFVCGIQISFHYINLLSESHKNYLMEGRKIII